MDVAVFTSLTRRLLPVVIITGFVLTASPRATANDYGAVGNGNWSNPATWTSSSGPGVPSSPDNVYIGSNYPNGAATTATVTLTQSQSASSVFVGYDIGQTGTLNLSNFNLNVSGLVYLGHNVGTSGSITRGSGSITANAIYVDHNNSYTFGAADAVNNLYVYDNSAATTAGTGNVIANVSIDTGSSLTLGADLNVNSQFDLRASGSSLNMAGHRITSASTILLGYYGTGVPTIVNRGPMTAQNLYVSNFPFSISASDSINNFYLSNVSSSMLSGGTVSGVNLSSSSALTTTTTGSISGSVNIATGSKLSMGADMNISATFNLQDTGSTLDMGNHALSTGSNITIGYNGVGTPTIVNRGTITTPYLYVSNQPFNLIPGDSIGNLYYYTVAGGSLGGNTIPSINLANTSSLTTTTTADITANASIATGSKLTMGADMIVSSSVNLQDTGSTLDMGGHKMNANQFTFGYYGGVPTLVNRGPISVQYLYASNQPFSLSASDSVTNFYLNNVSGSTLSGNTVNFLQLDANSVMNVSGTGAVTSIVNVDSGSKLTLGTDMVLGNQFNLQDTGSTLDMGGHKLTAANAILIGWNGTGNPTIVNRGPLATNDLYVAYQPFSLAPPDSVSRLHLYGVSGSTLGANSVANLQLQVNSLMTTTATANVTYQVDVQSGSKLTLGADMSLANYLNLQDTGSTLDMGGHKLTAPYVYFNWYGSDFSNIVNRGPLTAGDLYVANQPFSLTPSDSVSRLHLYSVSGSTLGGNTVANLQLQSSSSMTTTSTANVTYQTDVQSGSKLTLGADMTLANYFNLQDTGTTLDMAGHKITAPNIYINWYGSGVTTIVNRGPLAATELYVAYQPFSLIPADSVSRLHLYTVAGSTLGANSVANLQLQYSSSLATTTTANVTYQVDVQSASILKLGADMTLANFFNLQDSGSTLDMGGHKISAYYTYLGWYGGNPITITNPGAVSTNFLYAGYGTVPLLANGSSVSSQITLSTNAVLALQRPDGQITGMTFQGSTSSALNIDNTSQLQLTAGSSSGPAWVFRWQDVGGSWESTLSSMIAAGRIAVSATSGYSIFDDEGYTYIATPTTIVWNGGGADNNWSTAGNWSGTALTTGHWLRFGALTSGGHTTNNNNLAAGSLFYGIFFDAAAPSYSLQGNAIQLSGDVLNQSGSNQTIDLNIQLVPGNGAFNSNTIAFDSGAMKITDSGSISGSGMALMKTGSGTLVLSGTNTYNGGTIVTAGKLIITSSNSILDGSDLFVGTNVLTKFAAPIVGDAGIPTASSPVAVPEPGTVSIYATIFAVATFCRLARSRRTMTTRLQ